MRATITEFHSSTSGTFCERETEGVTIDFEDGGFL